MQRLEGAMVLPWLKSILPNRLIRSLYRMRVRLARMWSIIRTPYWRLLLHDHLNFRKTVDLDLQVKLIATEDSLDLVEINNLRLYWPQVYKRSSILSLYKEISRSPEVNPHAYEVGDVRIKSGEWVVDAGACEGFFTMSALQRGANVLIIEPVPELARALKRTFAHEIERGTVKLIQAGLGEAPGRANLQVDPESVLMSKIDSAGHDEINIVSLDQLIEERVIPKIDFIKMDIEGFEIQAINGAKRVLVEQKPKLSIAVYHQFENAKDLRATISRIQPEYKLYWRGIFIRPGFGKPRPFMLLGHS